MKFNEENDSVNQNENTAKQNNSNNFVETNPIINFFSNLADAANHIWWKYYDWIIDVAWKKLFLVCLLVIIFSSCIFYTPLAKFFVLGSFILKCFIGKEDQIKKETHEAEKPVEES
jgi:hypothetical protein